MVYGWCPGRRAFTAAAFTACAPSHTPGLRVLRAFVVKFPSAPARGINDKCAQSAHGRSEFVIFPHLLCLQADAAPQPVVGVLLGGITFRIKRPPERDAAQRQAAVLCRPALPPGVERLGGGG